ncbi:hypothetical protein RYO59_001309 [Thermosynechococcaceae cyanobacterium Okahandja]
MRWEFGGSSVQLRPKTKASVYRRWHLLLLKPLLNLNVHPLGCL